MFKDLLTTTALISLCSGGVQASDIFTDSTSSESVYTRKKVQTPPRSTSHYNCCEKLKEIDENIGQIDDIREPLDKLRIIEKELKKGGGKLTNCVKRNFELVNGHHSPTKGPLDEQLKKAIHSIDEHANQLTGTNGAINTIQTQLGVTPPPGGSLTSETSTQLQAHLYNNLNSFATLLKSPLGNELTQVIGSEDNVVGPVLGTTLVPSLYNVSSDITSLPVTLNQTQAKNLGVLLGNVNTLLSDGSFDDFLGRLLRFTGDGISNSNAFSPMTELVGATDALLPPPPPR